MKIIRSARLLILCFSCLNAQKKKFRTSVLKEQEMAKQKADETPLLLSEEDKKIMRVNKMYMKHCV